MALVEKRLRTGEAGGGEVVLNYAEGPPAGPPLLLVPGTTLAWQTYLRMTPLLEPRWHVFACDLRGHGRSSRTPGRYRLVDYAADIVAMIRGAIGEPAVVMAHSLGGVAAIASAAQAPEAMRGLALLDPPLFYHDTRLQESKWVSTFQQTYAALAAGPAPEKILEVLAAQNPQADPQALMARARRLAQVDPELISTLLADGHMPGYDMDALLRQVQCPTLLLQYDLAHFAALEDDDADFARARLARCAFAHLDGVGHMAHNEAPERVVEVFEAWWAEAAET